MSREPVKEYHNICGHFVDDGDRFQVVVKSNHEYLDAEGDDIFHYGLDAEALEYAVASGEPVDNIFVVTSFSPSSYQPREED